MLKLDTIEEHGGILAMVLRESRWLVLGGIAIGLPTTLASTLASTLVSLRTSSPSAQQACPRLPVPHS